MAAFASEAHNLKEKPTAELWATRSMRRAQSVSNYMSTLAVAANRFRIMGYGEDQPLASNDTVEGRQANRRVEIAIFANDKLKGVARAQAEG